MPEEANVRWNEVEQFEYDGRHASEVSWTAGTLPTLAHRRRLDECGESRRINFLGRRNKHSVYLARRKRLDVSVQQCADTAENPPAGRTESD